MKKRHLLAGMFFIWGCGQGNSVPKGIVVPVKMQGILLDMFQADEVVNQQVKTDSAGNRFAKSKQLYQTIFKIHHITDSQFKQSFRYYEQHPTLMKIMLDSLQAQTARQEIKPLPKKTGSFQH